MLRNVQVQVPWPVVYVNANMASEYCCHGVSCVVVVVVLLLLWLCSMLCCVPIHLLITPYISSTGATCACAPGNNANQACKNGENGVPCSGNGECVCGQCRCTQLVIIELLPWQQ